MCPFSLQVLLINGRDVSAMTHEQVVNFIRASRECHSGELVLTVKQNGESRFGGAGGDGNGTVVVAAVIVTLQRCCWCW